MSHSTENLCMGTALCFTNFLISKKFMDKRGGGQREGGREGGSVKIFCQSFFVSPSQKFS